MIIHVTKVKIIYPYSVVIHFDNGTRKRVNLQNELYGPIFEPLRDPVYFAKGKLDLDSRTISWPNGADFSPDTLFEAGCEHKTKRRIPRSKRVHKHKKLQKLSDR